jgi:hypothetical protein
VARTQAYDVFLGHAWPDRRADAKDVHDLLIALSDYLAIAMSTAWYRLVKSESR